MKDKQPQLPPEESNKEIVRNADFQSIFPEYRLIIHGIDSFSIAAQVVEFIKRNSNHLNGLQCTEEFHNESQNRSVIEINPNRNGSTAIKAALSLDGYQYKGNRIEKKGKSGQKTFQVYEKIIGQESIAEEGADWSNIPLDADDL